MTTRAAAGTVRRFVGRLADVAGEVSRAWSGAVAAVSPLDVLRWPGAVREPERDLRPLH